jgi:hypothetical protein
MLVYQRVATVSWLHWPRRKMGRNKGFTCSSTLTTSTQLTPPAMHRKRVKHVRLSDSDSWGQIQALFLGWCFFAPDWGHIPGYSRYHLVMTNTLPWENPPIFNRYTIYKRPFSMAMLNNQRVFHIRKQFMWSWYQSQTLVPNAANTEKWAPIFAATTEHQTEDP